MNKIISKFMSIGNDLKNITDRTGFSGFPSGNNLFEPFLIPQLLDER